jgi:hypothetical protein
MTKLIAGFIGFLASVAALTAIVLLANSVLWLGQKTGLENFTAPIVALFCFAAPFYCIKFPLVIVDCNDKDATTIAMIFGLIGLCVASAILSS